MTYGAQHRGEQRKRARVIECFCRPCSRSELRPLLSRVLDGRSPSPFILLHRFLYPRRPLRLPQSSVLVSTRGSLFPDYPRFHGLSSPTNTNASVSLLRDAAVAGSGKQRTNLADETLSRRPARPRPSSRSRRGR